MQTCKVDGCGKPTKTMGYCGTHYARLWRTGDIGEAKIQRKAPKVTPETEQEIVFLLENSKLSYTKIGEKFGVSRGPVYLISKKYNIKRENPSKNGDWLVCKQCRGKFYKSKGHQTRGRSKFCSKQCYSDWQKTEENRGENNPNWKHGGYESETRKTPEWRTWRELVYKRDNYTCQLCKEVGGQLHPHHIKKRMYFPELMFEPLNGITLCVNCHMNAGVHVQDPIYQRVLQTKVLRNELARI